MRRPGRRHGPGGGTPWVVLALVVSLFALLVGRLGQVQLLGGPTYAAAEEQIITRTVTEEALRGRILDRSGRVLADNAFTTTVTVERRVLLDAADGGRALIARIASALDLPFERLWDKTMLCGTAGAPRLPACFNGSPYVPIPIATEVEPRSALSLLERPERFPGVGVVAAPTRRHPAPAGANAAHVLGHVAQASAEEVQQSGGRIGAEDLVGRAGLESTYDSVLRGTNGQTVVAIDPRGVVTSTLSTTPATAGRDLVTHLDARLQARVEAILAETVTRARAGKQRADAAAAVVMDVTNGAVVAAASNPTYDPDLFSGGISTADLEAISAPANGIPLRSRLTGETFPPASTFKVVSVPAAVAAGFSVKGKYDCSPSFRVGNHLFNNYESRGYGPIDLHRALVVSCDTVFYRLAYDTWVRLGGVSAPADVKDPFTATARAFGLGRKTGIDLPGEEPGRIPDRAWKREYWKSTREQSCSRARSGYPEVARQDPQRAAYLKALAVENCATGYQYRPGDAVNFSIGQGDLAVTPLQMASMYAAIANGGALWQPQVAAGVRRADGTLEPIPPRRTGTVPLRPDVLALMRSALRDVPRPGGSAASAFAGFPLDTYPVAGKTGTGEVYGKQATAWFAAYAPVNRPRYAVVVVVSQGGSGSKVAAPAVRRIYDAIRALGR